MTENLYIIILAGLIGLVLGVYVFRKSKTGEIFDMSVFSASSHTKFRSLAKISYKATLILLILFIVVSFIVIFFSGYLYSTTIVYILMYVQAILSTAIASSALMFLSLLSADAFYGYYNVMRRVKDRSLKIKITLLTAIEVIVLVFIVYSIYPVLEDISRYVTSLIFKTTAVS